MKIKILFMALMVAVASLATAQEKKDNKRQKMTAEQRIDFRVAKMQKWLKLDDAAAEKFAPLYKEYLQEMAKCRPDVVRGKELTDEQVKKNIEARMDAKEKAAKLDKKYFGKFSKFLTAKQLQKVFYKPENNGKIQRFAPQGKRPGKGFAKAPGRKGPKMNAGKREGFKKADCKKNDCQKGECKKECKEVATDKK